MQPTTRIATHEAQDFGCPRSSVLREVQDLAWWARFHQVTRHAFALAHLDRYRQVSQLQVA